MALFSLDCLSSSSEQTSMEISGALSEALFATPAGIDPFVLYCIGLLELIRNRLVGFCFCTVITGPAGEGFSGIWWLGSIGSVLGEETGIDCWGNGFHELCIRRPLPSASDPPGMKLMTGNSNVIIYIIFGTCNRYPQISITYNLYNTTELFLPLPLQ